MRKSKSCSVKIFYMFYFIILSKKNDGRVHLSVGPPYLRYPLLAQLCSPPLTTGCTLKPARSLLLQRNLAHLQGTTRSHCAGLGVFVIAIIGAQRVNEGGQLGSYCFVYSLQPTPHY